MPPVQVASRIVRLLRFTLEPLPWSLGALSSVQFAITSLLLLGVTQLDRATATDDAIKGIPGGVSTLFGAAVVMLMLIAGYRLLYRLDRRKHLNDVGAELHSLLQDGGKVHNALNPRHAKRWDQTWLLGVFNDHTVWWIKARGFVDRHFGPVEASLFEYSVGFKHTAGSGGINAQNLTTSVEKQLEYLYDLQKRVAAEVSRLVPR